MSSERTTNLIEMHGTVVSWTRFFGEILTDCGERLIFTKLTLQSCGLKVTPKVGDRVHFWASREVKVEISYFVQQIRMLVPNERNEKSLKILRDRHRAVKKRRDPSRTVIEEFTGVLERVDRTAGYFDLRLADGELLRVSMAGLDKESRLPHRGKTVRIKALELNDEWIASRLLPT